MKKINKVKIKINGKNRLIDPKMTLKSVIKRFKIPLDKVAIELNETIVDKRKLNKQSMLKKMTKYVDEFLKKKYGN